MQTQKPTNNVTEKPENGHDVMKDQRDVHTNNLNYKENYNNIFFSWWSPQHNYKTVTVADYRNTDSHLKYVQIHDVKHVTRSSHMVDETASRLTTEAL